MSNALANCVVCGASLCHNGIEDQNHHCDPVKEKRIEAGRHTHDERVDYPKLYGTRLYDGFVTFSDLGGLR